MDGLGRGEMLLRAAPRRLATHAKALSLFKSFRLIRFLGIKADLKISRFLRPVNPCQTADPIKDE